MKDSDFFEINTPQIVAESVDGEVIVVDLANGYYFSLSGTAAFIWSRLAAARGSFSEIFEDLQSAYTGEDMKSGLRSFLSQLEAENLIRSAQAKAGLPPKVEKIFSDSRKPFSKPVIEKFTDMKEFLLVDPIHEVNMRGWPHRREDSRNLPPASAKDAENA